MVLRGDQRRHVFAIGQTQEADLVALKKLFKHNLLLSRAQQRAVEEPVRGLDRRGARLADKHALARGQAVGLDYDGRMEEIDGALHLCRTGANSVGSSGNLVALHKLLGECLARLKLRGGLRGTKDAEALLLKRVNDAKRKWQLRADDSEIRLFRQRHAQHRLDVLHVGWNAAGHLGNAAVAGSADNLRDARAALDGPGKRVLAATGTEDENFHWRIPLRHWLQADADPKGYGRQWDHGKSNRGGEDGRT